AAVEDVVCSLAHGSGSSACCVAAGAGFSQSKATEHFPGRERWHITLLLSSRSESHDRRCAKRGVCRDRDRMRGIDLRHLVDHDHVAEKIEPGTAELFRPGNTEQAQLSHFLDVRPWKLCFRVELRGNRRYL